MAIEQYESRVRRARRSFLDARDDHDRWGLSSTERKLKKARQELEWAEADLRRAEDREFVAQVYRPRRRAASPEEAARLRREAERVERRLRRRREAERADANAAAGAAVAGGIALAVLVGALMSDD